MTNREAATLVLRLAGFYWLVTGLLQAVSTLASLMVPISPDMEWVHKPAFVVLVILLACAYPVIGAILLFKAPAFATRWSSKPDEVAPAIISFTAGGVLLGIYFFVLGLHAVIAPTQRWIMTAQLDNFSATALVEAAVYLGAGALLLARPRWLVGAVYQAH